MVHLAQAICGFVAFTLDQSIFLKYGMIDKKQTLLHIETSALSRTNAKMIFHVWIFSTVSSIVVLINFC